MLLFAAKVYASVTSGSLAIVASTLDSLLDLLSGFILWFTAFSMQTPNPYQYPIGKKRMQPLVCIILLKDYTYINYYVCDSWIKSCQGILVFASVMATLGLQIILESLRTMLSSVSPDLVWKASVQIIHKIASHVLLQHKEFSLTKEQRELGGWDHALCYIGQTASCSLLQIVQ